MREIKFRGWNGKSMYFKELHDLHWYSFDAGVEPWPQKPVDRQILSVMQYTGLKDSSGADIYEGDICASSVHLNQ